MKEEEIIFKLLSLMVPGLNIACTCHQAKDALCCQTTAGGTIAQKISTGEGAGVSTH